MGVGVSMQGSGKGSQGILRRGMVPTDLCSIGFLDTLPTVDDNAISSPRNSLPILCFHSSPRSTDEFFDVMPFLSTGGRRVVAMDTPGYGISENPHRSCSVDDIADAFLQVADSLGIDEFIVMGSLMGNFMAVSLASRYPDRVKGCVCANLYHFPSSPSSRNEKEQDPQGSLPIPDSWELKQDGSHLVDLHNKRKAWLDDELNVRVVQSELTYLVNRRLRYAAGVNIQSVSSFDFVSAAKAVVCPTLCIKGRECCHFFDKIGQHGTDRFNTGSAAMGESSNRLAQVVEINGPLSTINMINQAPSDFAIVVNHFLENNEL